MNKKYYYFVSYSALVKDSPVNPLIANAEIMKRVEIQSIDDIRDIEKTLVGEFNSTAFTASIIQIINYQLLRVEDME